ncbi:MAG: Spy/CpxP family protein refolding chaperone [Bacteroidia bacterium]
MSNLKDFFSGKIQWLVLSLVLINSAILVYMLLIKPNHSPQAKPGKLIIESLELDQEQVSQFDLMKKEHRMQMNQLDDQYKLLLTEYLSGLKNPQIDSVKNKELEEKMAAIQIQKAQITFSHFVQVKSICREDQQKKLNQIVPDLINVMAPVNKVKRP